MHRLSAFHGEQVAQRQGKGLHELVETQSEQTPDHIFVIFEGDKLTYAQLNNRANQLAHHLISLGVGPDVLVGIFIEPSLEMVIALLGILKAGGAYLPLDPAYPKERLGLMLKDAAVRLLLTQEQLVDRLPLHHAELVFMDRDREKISVHSIENCVTRLDDQNLAYVIYTSGSTGVPKGVCVSHRSVVNLLQSMQKLLRISGDDVFLAVSTMSFDIAALEIFLPLISGARLVVASRATALNGAQLADLLFSSSITFMQATPASWRMLIDAGWKGSDRLTILCGGEVLHLGLAKQLLERGAAVWNLYGPTETTIWSTACNLSRTTNRITIGRPINNTQVYLLDRHLLPVPPDVPGELYISGDGLARGYLNHADLTAEKFIPNPFDRSVNSRLYKSGDMGRYGPDGEIEYLGRYDQQVKIQGFRVELGEIETILMAHPQVREGAVITRELGAHGTVLIAYYVPRVEDPRIHRDVLTYLRKTLPYFMVPKLVMLAELPRTPAGKLDRNSLPSIPSENIFRDAFVPPKNELECTLIELWQTILRVQPIGVTDNFFDLGGDSLLAGHLLAQVENIYGRGISLASFLQEATVEYLSTLIEEPVVPLLSFLALQPSGSCPPFYAAGSHPDYKRLAESIGIDRRFYQLDVYALQEQRVMAGQSPYSSIKDIASYFLEQMVASNSTELYLLGGGCEGGVVAFEIAQQLRNQGKQVGLLIIWDTPFPGYDYRKPLYPLIYLLDKTLSLIKSRPEAIATRILRKLSSLRSSVDDVLINRHLQIQDSIFQALDSYVPEAYFGPIVFFEPSKRPAGTSALATGWQTIAAGGMEVFAIPGKHGDLLTQSFDQFAGRLKSCLDHSRES